MLRRVLFLIVVFLPCSALADPPPPDYSRTGVYIGAEGVVGVASKIEDGVQHATGLKGRVDAAFGVNGRIGYRLHPRVAVEGEFEWIDGFDFTVENNKKKVRGDTWFASGNVKGYVMTGRFQPFVLVGAGFYHAKYDVLGSRVSGGDAALRAGLGFDAYLTEHVAIAFDAQYVLPFGEVDDLDYTSVGAGLQYRF
jgi:opacity protein-like surface antigen